MLKDILKTLKINHYIKNLIVIIPLFFSMNYINIYFCLNCLLIFLSFCFMSSAVYVLNDLIDIDNDKLHPIKCKRPIASGRISKKIAIIILLNLLFLSIFIASKMGILCIIVIGFYFVLNLFYSLYLKNFAIIDVACIAIGFICRIVAGCFAINVIPSPFVVLMTFFASMFFTFSKRKMELQITGYQKCRESIKGFDIFAINQFILINAVLSVAFYFTYTMDKTTIDRAGTEYLYLTTIPFTLLVFRLLYLVNLYHTNDDPIIFMKDIMLKYIVIFYFIILILSYVL